MGAVIQGLQTLQHQFNRMLAGTKPHGASEQAIIAVTAKFHRYAILHTPFDTTSLRNSQRQVVDRAQVLGKVYIDPTARNSRTGMLTSEYGQYLHNRGMIPGRKRGTVQAFYPYTIKRYARRLSEIAIDILKRARVLP